MSEDGSDARSAEYDAPEGEVGSPSVVDHAGTPVRGKQGMTYIFGDTVPEGAQAVEVAAGVLWVRIPLPWSLDHINVYLFDEGDVGWTLVDTGAFGSRGREAWEALEQSVLQGRPIHRIIATHMHPDHLGLAGWLAERHGSHFVMTMGEYQMAQLLWLGASKTMPEPDIQFLLKNGLPVEFEAVARQAGYDSFKKGVSALPPQFERIEDGSILEIGGRRWITLIGRGHSPEHACLWCLDEPLFITGDQVLPEITSNVSVYTREPMANPLAHWMSALQRLSGLDGDPVVLPAHGPVFKGLHMRLNRLIDGHADKLERLFKACQVKPRTPVSAFGALYHRHITGFEFFLALGESIAHLHLLESVGALTRSIKEGVYHFTPAGDFDKATIRRSVDALPGIALRDLSDFAALS